MYTRSPATTGYDTSGIGAAHFTFSFSTLPAVKVFSAALSFDCAASNPSEGQSAWLGVAADTREPLLQRRDVRLRRADERGAVGKRPRESGGQHGVAVVAERLDDESVRDRALGCLGQRLGELADDGRDAVVDAERLERLVGRAAQAHGGVESVDEGVEVDHAAASFAKRSSVPADASRTRKQT